MGKAVPHDENCKARSVYFQVGIARAGRLPRDIPSDLVLD